MISAGWAGWCRRHYCLLLTQEPLDSNIGREEEEEAEPEGQLSPDEQLQPSSSSRTHRQQRAPWGAFQETPDRVAKTLGRMSKGKCLLWSSTTAHQAANLAA